MSTPETVGIVIAGAGCAGLSLAVHLVRAGVTDRRVLLLDPRTTFSRDRTWCFWNVGGPTPFDDAVTHSWKRWRVAVDGADDIIRHSDRFEYCHLPAHRFYERAREILRGFPNVEIRTGCAVESLHEEGTRVRVVTQGNEILAPLAFDSRPPARSPDSLSQHFLGVHVTADRDVFDTATATLMDFRVPQTDGPHFLYILPFSPRHALLEATFLSTRRLTRDGYLAAIRRYCDERYPGVAFTTVGEETGAIPMEKNARRPRKPSRVVRAGVAGGLVKPSTGYAFLAIQRWSERIAREMARGVEVPVAAAPRSGRAALMDRIFLAVLAAHPEEAPSLFLRLFRDTPSDRLIAFLTDTGVIADDIAVIRALPKTVFLQRALREILSPRRARAA